MADLTLNQTPMTFFHRGLTLKWRLVNRPQQNIYLRYANNVLIISGPKTLTVSAAQALIIEHWDQIQRWQTKTKQKVAVWQLNPEPYLLLWGQKTAFAVLEASRNKILVTKAKVVLFMPTINSDAISKLLRKLLRQEIEPVFETKVAVWVTKMNVNLTDYRFRVMKQKWGLCNVKTATVVFNLALAHLPVALSDYVIVHELAHLIHHNHSKAFWATVAQFCPDYLQARKQLNSYELKL